MTHKYNNTKILVIDDDRIILSLIHRFLEREGFDVYTALHGDEGIALFRQINPPMILTDINMPECSGFDILKLVKSESPITQIIVISGVGTTGDVIEALRFGACDFIYKPFERELLLHAVKRGLERYQLIKERIERKAILEREIQQRTKALRETFHATVKSLGRLIEMRDPYTSGHQHRVSMLAVAIGRELSMTSQELGVLDIAGQLHDIGKVAVPVELLVKPSKLSIPEFQLLKIHPYAGYEAIREIPFVESLGQDVATIIYQHHEGLDGTGYPRNLQGNEINPESNILSVADVVEAMSSHRPYREALNIEIAKKEISDRRGVFYSSDCVDACINLIERHGNNINQLFKSLFPVSSIFKE